MTAPIPGSRPPAGRPAATGNPAARPPATSPSANRPPVPSGAAIVLSILRKDLLQFSRDRLYMILSVAGLAIFIAAFWLIPGSVQEYAVLGLAHQGLGPLEAALAEEGEGGLKLIRFPDGESLKRVMAKEAQAWQAPDGALLILDRDDRAGRPKGAKRIQPALGLDFPPGFVEGVVAAAAANQAAAGGQSPAPAVKVYVNSDTPAELESAMRSMIRELAYLVAGRPLPVTEPPQEAMIVGQDRSGAQVPMRDRMRPLLAFFVLMVETFALSSLVAVELLHRTVVAVAATPAKTSQVLLAKLIFGALLAFAQALVLLLATGSFAAGDPLIQLAAVMAGALMFSGIAMLVGSMGKDFLGTLAWTMTVIMPFALPAIAALFPGGAPAWAGLIPSASVIHILNVAANYGAGWAETAPQFAVALIWVAALLGLGTWTLSRKVARL